MMKNLNKIPPASQDNLGNVLLVKRWLKAYGRWRALAMGLLILVMAYGVHALQKASPTTDRLIKLHMEGEISDMALVRKAGSLLDDKGVKGLLIVANSPGGTPTVSEAWGRLVQRFKKKNIPVVTITEDMCASGCYLSVVDSDRIFSYESSLVGSIGVIMTVPNFSNVLKKWDVNVDVIKSGPLKGEPHPMSPPSALYQNEMQNLVSDLGQWFSDRVCERRSISLPEHVKRIKTGEVFLAPTALKMNLIDEIADETAAMDYLKGLAKEPGLSFETFELKDPSWFEALFELKAHAFSGNLFSKLGQLMLR